MFHRISTTLNSFLYYHEERLFEPVMETAHREAQGAHFHQAIVRLFLAAEIRAHSDSSSEITRTLPVSASRDTSRSPSEQPRRQHESFPVSFCEYDVSNYIIVGINICAVVILSCFLLSPTCRSTQTTSA